ncbi:MAG TPA: response regulator [Tepidisphaeraceae bacterium]
MRQREPSTPPPSEAREVLIVEDESRLREMLHRAVREMGFNPTVSNTAESALREAENRAFDIAIVDLNLPGMGGLEMLEKLKVLQSDVQAIILTGFGDLDAARAAIRLDVVDFLTKPCALGTLEESLDRARRRRFKSADPDPLPSQPSQFSAPQEQSRERISLEELEQRHILAVLEKNEGNRTLTAAELGISIRKLYYRIGQYQKQGLLP